MTVVEGPGVDDPRGARDPAWSELPVEQRVDAVSLIVARGGSLGDACVRLPLGGSS